MTAIVNGPIPDNFMTDISNRLSSLRFDVEKLSLEVLDQLKLPHEKEFITLKNTQDAFDVIRSMQVRGAPLIAVVGALRLYLDIHAAQGLFKNKEDAQQFVSDKADFLIASRPTAINLKNAMNQIIAATSSADSTQDVVKKACIEILSIYHGEQEENRRLIWNGYQELIAACPGKEKLTLMTICNTGSLATCSWGTAIGVICALHQADKVEMVYALETRPYNQGVRLTATELLHNKIPFKLITDSMAGWAMKTKGVDAVLVGADQVALNGDTANKIGTYVLAVLAKHHQVKFYPVVPFTTVNVNRETGASIPIEERPAQELIMVNGSYVGAMETPVWNPAFDVTPADLITKVITDFGNYAPKDLKDAVARFVLSQ